MGMIHLAISSGLMSSGKFDKSTCLFDNDVVDIGVAVGLYSNRVMRRESSARALVIEVFGVFGFFLGGLRGGKVRLEKDLESHVEAYVSVFICGDGFPCFLTCS